MILDIFPLVRATECPCPYGPNKPKVCIRTPLGNLSDGISAKLSQISKKWSIRKNLVLGCRCAHSKKNRIYGHGNPIFGTFYVKNTCFSRITFFSEQLDRIFWNFDSPFQCAYFGTKILKIECQGFEIWHFKVGRFHLYTTKSEFLCLHLYTTKSELP